MLQKGDGIMEFGLRRAQGMRMPAFTARVLAMIGGCIGTSNVLTGQMFDVRSREPTHTAGS